MATITNLNDFAKGFELIAAHSPLVLYYKLTHTANSYGTPSVIIQAQSPADNQTEYTFTPIFIETIETVPATTWEHYFRLDISEIIKKIANEPTLEKEGTGSFTPSRLATEIEITLEFAPIETDSFTYWYQHGFNQVHDPDGSCLVDFADLDIDAVIPIAPGAPMIFFAWINADSGPIASPYIVDLDQNAFPSVSGQAISTSLTKSLYEFYYTTWNEKLRTEWNGVPLLYYLGVYDVVVSTTTIQSVKHIALTEACENGIVLSWLNRYGTYSYLAFNKYYRTKIKGKPAGFSTIDIIDPADAQGRQLSRGFNNVNEIITATAQRIPSEYLEIIEDLFYSMDVYMYTGAIPENTFSTDDWIRVTVKGELPVRTKKNHENVTVEIMPPAKYTQTR